MIPVLCRLRPRPRSIAFRPWAAPLGHERVLDWCLGRIAALFPGARLVLVVDDVDGALLKASAVPGAWEVCVCPYGRDAEAFVAAAVGLGIDTATCVHLESALLPADAALALDRAFVEGLVGVADFGKLPRFVAPERVDVTTARILLPFLSQHQMEQTFGELFALAGLAGVRDRDGLRCTRVLADADSPSAGEEPVAFESQADISALAAVAGAADEPLDSWRRAVHGRRYAARRAVVAGGPRQGPSTDARRVLFVSNPSALSGAETSTVELVTVVRALGVQPAALVVYRGDFTARLEASGCAVYCTDAEFATSSIESWNLVDAAVRDWGPHLVHYCGRSGQVALQVAASAGIPVVCHGHVPLAHPYYEVVGWADWYIAVSTSIRAAMRDAGVDDGLIHTIPNGVDVEKYRNLEPLRVDARRAMGLGSSAFAVATLSRFSAEKRLHDVVAAVAAARQDGRDVVLLMGGEGHSCAHTRASVLTQIHQLGLTDAVRLLGHVDDVRPVLAAADAVVICSDAEGLPMLALEAMASGLPCISTRVGGLSALLGAVDDPHPCGLAIPIGQPDVLAEAIGRLDRDRGLGRELGLRGKQRVAAEYSGAAMGARVVDVYGELLRPDSAFRARPPR